jgi:sulfatase maturation enzyme AslB (radical SAM superfamily)
MNLYASSLELWLFGLVEEREGCSLSICGGHCRAEGDYTGRRREAANKTHQPQSSQRNAKHAKAFLRELRGLSLRPLR